jgi:uncharacterized protein (DUF58 family)
MRLDRVLAFGVFVTPRLAGAAVGAAVAVGVLGALTSLPGWATLAAADVILATLLVGDFVLAPGPSSLGLERSSPDVLVQGREDQVEVRLRNPQRRPLRVSLRDSAPSSLHRSPLLHAAVLGPGERAVLRATVRPARRGWASLGPVTVRTAGPFQLGGRQQRLDMVDEIKVYPALPGRREVDLRLRRARMLQAGERSSALRGGGTEFDSLREYHPDDEFRRINWRATARTAKPIANLYREERNQQVVLLMDAGRTMAATVAGVSRFEHALDAGFAVGELAVRIGDHLGMVAFASDVISTIPPRSGRAQPRRVIDQLFSLTPRLEAADYQHAFASLLARNRRRSLLLLLTDLAPLDVMEPLVRALPALLRRHLVLLAAVQDPELRALARLVPSSSDEAYRKAAAGSLLFERERAAARLRAIGVEVVDVPPGALAGALADRYLRIKALGRL